MMNNPKIFQPEQQDIIVNEAHENDLQIIVSMVLKKWYLFMLAAAVALIIVRFYLNHTMPVYRTTATIIINETGDRPTVDNSEILQGLGLPGGMRNLHNQNMILRSVALTESTLNELPFEVEFYTKGLRNRVPLYPVAPLRILSESEIPLPRDTEFLVDYIGNNKFTIISENDYFPFQKTASFRDTIKIQDGSFRIECRNEEWFKINSDKKLYFTIHSRISLINSFKNRINVELMSKEGSILVISMIGTNRAKDMDFLNKHLEGFQAISLNKKNMEAQRRIQFIESQLIGISDSLSITENRLQQFRSSNRVMDLSAQGQAIIEQVTRYDNEKARLNLEANYYDYLAEYLAKEETGEIPIIPMTMGITDPGLTRLVEELAELQSQLSLRGAGEMNPLQRNLEQRVYSAKASLRETLNGLRRANSLARSENQQQINRANSQASRLPVTERQLLGIERKFRLNDELYTFLLETRANLEMQKASNKADSEIIDPADARFSTLISPHPMKLYLVGLLGSMAIIFLIVYLNLIYSKKLKDEDIRKITDLPVIGTIPLSTDFKKTVVFSSSGSSISEAFRSLRSRIQFFTKETTSPVILITSTMPEDGKTFTAINLASVYSLLGKRTILVGFDLRKPKIYEDFKLENEKGVSTWLIGKDSLQEIIQKTEYENLWIISSGPIPPNPSELTALDKTKELIRVLKEQFDYIIIDSSPIGIVSDTYHLASLSDACLVVVKPGKTLKNLFINTLNEIRSSNIKGISMVINGIKPGTMQYGYGEKYGYTNEETRLKKHFFKKKRN